MKLTTARLKRLMKEELEAVMQEDDSPMGAGEWTTSDAQLAKDASLANDREYDRQQLKFRMAQDRLKRVRADQERKRKEREEREFNKPIPGRLSMRADELYRERGRPENVDFDLIGHVKTNLAKYMANNAEYVGKQSNTPTATIKAYANEIADMDGEKLFYILPDLKAMLGSQFDKGIKNRTLLRKLGSLMTFGGFRQ